jgi:hypothetical protein
VYVLVDLDENGQPIKDPGDSKGNAALTRRTVWREIGSPGVVRDRFVEIERGVQPGDWVVVSGMQRLKSDRQQTVKAEKYVEETPVPEGTGTASSTAPAALKTAAESHE